MSCGTSFAHVKNYLSTLLFYLIVKLNFKGMQNVLL